MKNLRFRIVIAVTALLAASSAMASIPRPEHFLLTGVQ